jgi:carbamoyl-phosphate synthase/aspartate carbamoyltransferase
MSQNITIPNGNLTALRPALARAVSDFAGVPAPPSTAFSINENAADVVEGVLELADGSAYCGISFGAEKKSIAGECVFQTGLMPQFKV